MKTLEELDYVFAVPSGNFAKYQLIEALPWWIKRYVFWRKGAKLRPLYQEGGGEAKEGKKGEDSA